MKKWKIFVTFFRNLYDDHYTVDRSWNPGNYAFVKVNEKYPLETGDNKLPYEVLFEHDFPGYRPDLQEKGYCENSVLYHLYNNGVHEAYDYIGFIEYDHVLGGDFTRAIQEKLDGTERETIFAFQKFTFRQLWDQAILMDPRRREKVDGRPDSKWNCINVILKDYNDFYRTAHTVDRLAARDCFPICHSFLIPTRIFGKIMPFHAFHDGVRKGRGVPSTQLEESRHPHGTVHGGGARPRGRADRRRDPTRAPGVSRKGLQAGLVRSLRVAEGRRLYSKKILKGMNPRELFTP